MSSGDVSSGVGGWLLLLSRLLIVWQPLNLAVGAMGALDAIAVRGAPVVAVLVVRVIVTAVGVAAVVLMLGVESFAGSYQWSPYYKIRTETASGGNVRIDSSGRRL